MGSPCWGMPQQGLNAPDQSEFPDLRVQYLIALGVLRQHLVGTAADTETTRKALRLLDDELEDVGGGSARRAAQGTDALRQSLIQTHAAGEQLGSGMTNAFASIVSGSQGARQAVAGLLQEMSRMLAHRGFSALLGGLFGGATQISGPAMGGLAARGAPLRSFDGGGFTGMGARVGGVDGRGGFPAILHPNETVIDHTKGGASHPVEVTINVDARYAVDGVAGQINRALAREARRIVEEAVAKGIDRRRRGLGSGPIDLLAARRLA